MPIHELPADRRAIEIQDSSRQARVIGQPTRATLLAHLLTVDLFSFFSEQQIGFAQAPSVAHSEVDGWGAAEDVAEAALIPSGKDSDRTDVVTEGTQLPLVGREVMDWNARVVL